MEVIINTDCFSVFHKIWYWACSLSFPISEGKYKLTEKYSWHKVRHNSWKTSSKSLLYRWSHQDYSTNHLKTNGWALFSSRLWVYGQGMVAWPAECGIAAGKVAWGSEWIKQLKDERAVDATAGGSIVGFGDLCNWEKTRNLMLKIRNSICPWPQEKLQKRDNGVGVMGVGRERQKVSWNADTGLFFCGSVWKSCLD